MCHRWTSARFAVDFDFLGEAFGPDQHGGVATSQHVLQKHQQKRRGFTKRMGIIVDLYWFIPKERQL